MNLWRPIIRPLQLNLRDNMTQHFSFKYHLGIIILLLCVAFPVATHAACEVTLQWDANNPNPDGYLLYGREAGQSYDYNDPWWQGDPSFTQCIIDRLDESKAYYFVVRAYVENPDGSIDVSGDSNEVSFAYGSSSSSDNSSSLADGSSSSSGGSSDGGITAGCFIQSLF